MSRALCAASAAGAVAGLVAIGCGGASSGSSDPLAKDEFIQQANSICKDAEADRRRALEDAAGGEPDVAELSLGALSPVQRMAEELGELGAPVGEAKEVQAILSAFESGIAQVKADPADPTAAIAAFAEANRLAEEYGLTDCTI